MNDRVMNSSIENKLVFRQLLNSNISILFLIIAFLFIIIIIIVFVVDVRAAPFHF